MKGFTDKSASCIIVVVIKAFREVFKIMHQMISAMKFGLAFQWLFNNVRIMHRDDGKLWYLGTEEIEIARVSCPQVTGSIT